MRKQMETMLFIGLGGFAGANARYFVSGWMAAWVSGLFPWGTLAVNLSGSILLGMFISWSGNQVTIDPRLRLFLAVGFFGAYTTFSTYANESVALLQRGDWAGALSSILGTNLLCVIGAFLGVALGSRI